MARFQDLAQKAFFLGVGAANFAAEKAGSALKDIQAQAQNLADDMVERGEMTTEEARKFVDDLVAKAQQQAFKGKEDQQDSTVSREPRKIEIVMDDDTPQEITTTESESGDRVSSLKDQVKALEEELKRLQNQS